MKLLHAIHKSQKVFFYFFQCFRHKKKPENLKKIIKDFAKPEGHHLGSSMVSIHCAALLGHVTCLYCFALQCVTQYKLSHIILFSSLHDDASIFSNLGFQQNDLTDILKITFVHLYHLPANLFTFEKRATNQIKMIFFR